ncbi:SapC family protein [Qipengyuania sp. DSG2-2]|uniref:SapC family protein n=1 Tax=Qipengyuania sp. DGS2-2 TaxID=3349631 RepID=UPI0036D26F7B
MASAPQPSLPLFYKDLMPLNSRDHLKWNNRRSDTAKWLIGHHAIPLTADEFVQAQRDFPIVFSAGDDPLPLALMGLNEGVNTFVDKKGKVSDPIYIPAYIRRYPFMLARIQEGAEQLSLCFDPTSDTVGEFKDGERLFTDDGKATDETTKILDFCQKFEEAGIKTKALVEELKKHDLLMESEISISQDGNTDQPYLYRGFQMVDQEKLRALDEKVTKEWMDNGMLAVIHAHIFSLDLMRVIFSRQVQQGTGPKLPAEAAKDAAKK